MSKYVEIFVDEVLSEGEKALLIVTEDGEEEWIPYSQMEDEDALSLGDRETTLSVTRWICEQKEIPYS